MRFPNPFHAIGAFHRAVKTLFSVKKMFVSEQKANSRLAACYKCPDFDGNWSQCQVCTCAVLLKAQLTSETCPKGRWLDE
jgi:hypothetical protein